MSVTLDLRLVDHHHVVERGIPAVNAALVADDTSLLMDYILSIPVMPDPEVIANRRDRWDQLRELKAPDVIIQNEERLYRLVSGEAYSRQALSAKSMGELRELLGTWEWVQNSFSIDKAWYELDWFLQPAAGPGDLLMYPIRPPTGDPSQSILDRALHGGERSPLDGSGSPIIRPCGSNAEDCFGYNPPAAIASIDEALAAIDEHSWNALIQWRVNLYNQTCPDLGDAISEIVLQEQELARMALAVARKAYRTARERGFGVACEYSL